MEWLFYTIHCSYRRPPVEAPPASPKTVTQVLTHPPQGITSLEASGLPHGPVKLPPQLKHFIASLTATLAESQEKETQFM